jgi:hypothetical protein
MYDSRGEINGKIETSTKNPEDGTQINSARKSNIQDKNK